MRHYLQLGLTLVTLLTTGCPSFDTSEELTWTVRPDGQALPAVDWSKEKCYFRKWGRIENLSTTTASVSGWGGTATGFAITRGKKEEPSLEICDIARQELPFDLVTPILGTGPVPGYYLEGSFSFFGGKWPWWSWLQGLDLWVHALLFPTIGDSDGVELKLSLLDSEGRLLRHWEVRWVHHWVGWLLSGGGYPIETREKLTQELFARAGKDMREATRK
jgi:hypothetical protein